MKINKKLGAIFLSAVLALSILPVSSNAASPKSIKKVTVKIAGKDYTKKTYPMKKGDKKKLSIIVSPATAKKTIKYSSSKKEVASVSKNGLVTAKKAGTAKITITVTGKNKKKKISYTKIQITTHSHKYYLSTYATASCTKDGWRIYKCSCGVSKKESIKKKGHNYKISAHEKATCTESGIFTYTCNRCGSFYQKLEKATGHSYVRNSKGELVCKNCGEYKESSNDTTMDTTKKEETTTEKKNEITTEKKNETTTSKKEDTTTEKKEDTKPEQCKEHEWEVIGGTDPTCEEKGVQTVKCKKCGIIGTRVRSALGHDYEQTVKKAATCTEKGTWLETCKRCGKVTESEIPALNHSSVRTSIHYGGCIDGITTTKTCAYCGKVLSEETTEKYGSHLFYYASTDGKTDTWKCLRKNCSVEATIPHSCDHEKSSQTFVEDSHTVKKCIHCGIVMEYLD